MDVMSLVGKDFDFPLTRDTILKLETRRQFLHYLRLEQFQFKDLGTSCAHGPPRLR